MNRHPHILNAATNLLGICFVIIGGLKFTNRIARSYSDETVLLAAFLLFMSVMTSYFAIRNGGESKWQLVAADATFIAGIFTLMTSVLIAAAVL